MNDDIFSTVQEIFNANYKTGAFYKTLREISYDSSNKNEMQYLSESNALAFSFDDVLMDFYKGADRISSPDVIYFNENKRVVFLIEFKNGNLDSDVMKLSLRVKPIEGCIGLTHIVQKARADIDFKRILDLRKVYIVVYNQKRCCNLNKLNIFFDRKLGLGRYEGIFFEKAYFFEAKMFDRSIVKTFLKG